MEELYEPGYPRHKYSLTADRQVFSAEEETALGPGWYDTPEQMGLIVHPTPTEMVAPNVPRPMPYAPNAWGPPPGGPGGSSHPL